MMRLMEHPFRNIEMQTTGVMIDNPMLRFLRNHVGVNTIALSLFSFNNQENMKCRGSLTLDLDIAEFCKQIKLYDFNLRLCINLTKYFDDIGTKEIFNTCRELGANQITFRRLYDADDGGCQSEWVKKNDISPEKYHDLRQCMYLNPVIRKLEYGQAARSIEGISVVLDDDCMAKGETEDFKYLIIRPDGKLYGSWDDPASLIF
jgi:hypothetical protein